MRGTALKGVAKEHIITEVNPTNSSLIKNTRINESMTQMRDSTAELKT